MRNSTMDSVFLPTINSHEQDIDDCISQSEGSLNVAPDAFRSTI